MGNTAVDSGVTWTCEGLRDFDIAWKRRTRLGGSLGGDNTPTDGVGGPIEEDSEQHKNDIVETNGRTLYDSKTI